jgi:hypothetical protein
MLRSEILKTDDTISPAFQTQVANVRYPALGHPDGVSQADLVQAITLALDGVTQADRLWSANLLWQNLDSFNIEQIKAPGIACLMRLAVECGHTRLRDWARLVLRNTFGVEVSDETSR